MVTVPEHHEDDGVARRWLERALRYQLPAAAGLCAALLALGALAADAGMLAGAALAAVYLGLLALARRALRRGSVGRAGLMMSYGLLCAAALALPLDQNALPATLLVYLGAVAVALPALALPALRRLIIAAWCAAVLSVTLHETLFHPAPLALQLGRVLGVAAAAALVLLLLWIGRAQIAALVAELSAANASLRRAHGGLQAEVHARTAELAAAQAEHQHAHQELAAAHAQLMTLTGQLQRSRDALRALFDGLDEGMALLDGDGRVVAINQVMASLFERQPVQAAGQPWADLCAPAGLEALAQLAHQTLHDSRPRRRRATYPGAGGRQRVADVQTLPVFGAGGTHAIVHAADITDRLQMEALAGENERFAAAGRLAAVVAHELNTPLLSIRSCLYMAGRAPEADQRDRYLQLAEEEIRRVGDILRQMLDLYRPSTGSHTPIDLNALIDRVLLLTGSVLTDHRVAVERELDAAVQPIWGRADQITQVLLNLILNAVDAMPDGGALTIRTGMAERGSARLDLADTGIGITPEVARNIFEPFFTTKPQGSGLGLAICRKIVEQHGGAISVDSEPGRGSTFTLLLPLGDAAAELTEVDHGESHPLGRR